MSRRKSSAHPKLLRTNTSGHIGASWNAQTGKWIAYITVNRKRKYLGQFKTAKDAGIAYKRACKALRPEFDPHEEKKILLTLVRDLYARHGIKALSTRFLYTQPDALGARLGRAGLKQAALLAELNLTDEHTAWRDGARTYRGVTKPKWSWEAAVAKAKEIVDRDGELPTVQQCRLIGLSSFTNAVHNSGHTWEDLRAAVGLKALHFQSSRNGMRWRSRPEACLSNFLYARGIQHTQACLLMPVLAAPLGQEWAAHAQGLHRRIGANRNRPIPPDGTVLPSETDRKIQTFDYPQPFYRPRQTARNQLVIFLPGTNGRGQGFGRLGINAALLGYHVIVLMYPDDIAAAVCRNDEDPAAFATFRWAIIEGGNSPYLKGAITRTESIENRIIKLLQYLKWKDPGQRWEQFLNGDQIFWEKIVIGGMSQGGGHAALIATRHLVARVVCFGAPKDYSIRLHAPAAWCEKSVTPPSRYFAFNNTHDRQGCAYQQQVEILNKLGIAQVAGIVNVDSEQRPYKGAHALFTNWPGVDSSIDTLSAHTSVIDDEPWGENGPLFRPVWRYMLGSPITQILRR